MLRNKSINFNRTNRRILEGNIAFKSSPRFVLPSVLQIPQFQWKAKSVFQLIRVNECSQKK